MTSISQQLAAAMEHHRAGRLAQAETLYCAILDAEPDHPEALHRLGVLALQLRQPERAAELLSKAVALRSDSVEAHYNLGVVLEAQGRLDEAAASYHRALELRPAFAEAHYNLGVLLDKQGRWDEAAASFRRALEIRPDVAEAHNNLGAVLKKLGRLDEAIASFECALQRRPDYAEAHNNLGVAFDEQGRWNDAVASFERALQQRPDYAEAHNNLGVVLDGLGRLEEASASFHRALALQPDAAGVYTNLGFVLKKQGRLDEAIACFQRALEMQPDSADALIALVHQKKQICDWSGLAPLITRCLDMAGTDASGITPFSLLSLPSTPAQQLACARQWAARHLPVPAFRHPPADSRVTARLRVGYLSTDFRSHAVAYLVAQLFELHDRSRFEVIGFSYGPDDHSDMRRRLMQAFDEFVDLRSSSHHDAARRIHDARIDILVDLTGYTKDARSKILAYRPAPIQANFLGYPGTMGAEFMDYLIADAFLIPPDQGSFYSEKIVTMPDCYQPNDRKRAIAESVLTRESCGLPQDGFVFCCFNNNYKITPEFFDIWAGLLRKISGSVLWLLEASPYVTDNLRREAEARGVSGARLVFAPRVSPSQHLTRFRLADLFLDTLPYGAHTTTSDSLWAGLPVLTCVGDTFAGRVGGSLLRAAGLPELITNSPTEYAARALALATTHRNELARLRSRLEENRLRCPLFDSERFARHLEQAFERMWTRHRQGLPPESFAVTPLPAV